ncbi:MAG: hypothetical protein GY953_05810, partial [bacterium]|nr:hypothetical protein [bacterium]
CTVNAGTISASGSGASLTVTVEVTFRAGFAGTKNIYLYAIDAGGLDSGWQTRGSWTPDGPLAPEAVSVSPSNGYGSGGRFQFTYSDPDGYQQLTSVSALINAALSQANGCSLDYNLTDQSLWLRADDGLNWVGPLPLGSAETLANSQCTVALLSAEGSGATLTLTVNITFAVEFPGVKSIYLYAEDSTGRNSGWRQLGMWNQRPAHAPEGLSVSPMSGSGSVGGFRFHFSDQDGY